MRAIKGILRIAGGAKRANPERSELEIMMRALRDSNVTKFVNADVGIFLSMWGTDDPAGDFDGNGIVGGADFGILLAAFGPCV